MHGNCIFTYTVPRRICAPSNELSEVVKKEIMTDAASAPGLGIDVSLHSHRVSPHEVS